jgi:hypothetical protein
MDKKQTSAVADEIARSLAHLFKKVEYLVDAVIFLIHREQKLDMALAEFISTNVVSILNGMQFARVIPPTIIKPQSMQEFLTYIQAPWEPHDLVEIVMKKFNSKSDGEGI